MNYELEVRENGAARWRFLQDFGTFAEAQATGAGAKRVRPDRDYRIITIHAQF